MKPAFVGAILGGLFMAGSTLVWLVAGRLSAVAVVVGGLVPIAISVGSLAVFHTRRPRLGHQRKYQRFVLINFLVKVVFIGLWTAVILLATPLPREPFVVSLLFNFFGWHLFEAFRYQRQLQAARQ